MMEQKNKTVGINTQDNLILLMENAIEFQQNTKENFGITLLISECIKILQTQFVNKQIQEINDEMVILLRIISDDINANN